VTAWDKVHRDLIIGYVMAMKSDQEYASSTVARKVAAIKSFFHYLVETKQLADDPTATLDSPKVKKEKPTTISPEDVERLLGEPGREESSRGPLLLFRNIWIRDACNCSAIRKNPLCS
jgi:integrase/recombinase XerD